MSTIHLAGEPGDYADLVLMPGDPLRAKYIAETYLDDVRQVNDIRNMLGFTGSYQGTPVSVQGSGMGVPSIQIYATELIKDFGVTRIVRVGTCGTIQPGIALGDVVLGLSAGTDSAVNRIRFEGRDLPATASWELVRAVADAADDKGLTARVGPIYTSDFFYDPAGDRTFELLQAYGFLAVEMEAAGLYGVAAEFGAKALTVATVTDLITSGDKMSAEDRQTSLDDMIGLVLDALT